MQHVTSAITYRCVQYYWTSSCHETKLFRMKWTRRSRLQLEEFLYAWFLYWEPERTKRLSVNYMASESGQKRHFCIFIYDLNIHKWITNIHKSFINIRNLFLNIHYLFLNINNCVNYVYSNMNYDIQKWIMNTQKRIMNIKKYTELWIFLNE